MTPVPGFTRKAIAAWAKDTLRPGCVVVSDGLACFAGVTDAGCQHRPIVVGGRKPRELPQFNWVNTVLGNLKTRFGGAYHALDFDKYGTRYLGAFAYRFNFASTWRRSRCVCSRLPPPLGHAQGLGSVWLKNLPNQEKQYLL